MGTDFIYTIPLFYKNQKPRKKEGMHPALKTWEKVVYCLFTSQNAFFSNRAIIRAP